MLDAVKADIDHARAETSLAIAEVIFPEPPERRIETEPFDLRPFVEETPSPISQGQRIALAKILRRDDFQIGLFQGVAQEPLRR